MKTTSYLTSVRVGVPVYKYKTTRKIAKEGIIDKQVNRSRVIERRRNETIKTKDNKAILLIISNKSF